MAAFKSLRFALLDHILDYKKAILVLHFVWVCAKDIEILLSWSFVSFALSHWCNLLRTISVSTIYEIKLSVSCQLCFEMGGVCVLQNYCMITLFACILSF